MLRATRACFAKKHGFHRVYWRTKQESVVDRGMKTPLLTERPYPLAEVVRRMVRIRCKYEDSEDTMERGLLRGEYKYYTGKACDMRHASTADMVAAIECCGFFGFWDNKLLRLVEQALIDRVAELEALELMLLFRSLPKVHLTGSDLYLDVCDRLAALTDHGDLTAEEIVSIVAAAEPDTPKHILRNMLVNHLRAYVGRVDLSAADALAVLRALAMLDPSSDPREEEQLRDLAGRVVRQLLEGLGTLTASQIGEAAHYLSLLGALEVEFPTRESAELTRALVDAFCAQLHGVDAGAVASMIESVSAADPAFVVRVGDTIRDNHDQFAPDEHATVLEGVVGTANLAVAGRMPAGREAAIDLLKDVLEVHETIVTNTAFDPDARTYLRSVEALAMVDSRLRQRSPQQFNAAARRVLASLAANARSLSASECVRALSAAASLGTAATDAVLDSLLRWLLEAGQCLAPGDVGPILRAAQALPPLPTTRSRTRMTHEVLPKLLDRADGGSGRAADP